MQFSDFLQGYSNDGGWRFGGKGGGSHLYTPEAYNGGLLDKVGNPAGAIDKALNAAPVTQGLLGTPTHESNGGDRNKPSAWSQMSPDDQAGWYAEHPNYAAVTQALQSGFKALNPWGLSDMQEQLNPGFQTQQSLVARGVAPSQAHANGLAFSGMQGNAFGSDGWKNSVNTYNQQTQQRQQQSAAEAKAIADYQSSQQPAAPQAAAASPNRVGTGRTSSGGGMRDTSNRTNSSGGFSGSRSERDARDSGRSY